MPTEHIEVYAYDLSYKCANHLAKLSVRDGCYDTVADAESAALDSIQWYIDHGFLGSSPDDFNVSVRNGYIHKRVDA